MTIQVTIIGLGQVGASVGLALAEKTNQFLRVGNDVSSEISRQAQKIGAIDRVENNLPRSVENADIVLLDLPLEEVKRTLEIVAQDLKPEVVVLDTSPVHVGVTEWAKQILPEDRFFVKFSPSLNPAYLNDSEWGVDAAHGDMFKNSMIAISCPSGTKPDAIKLASDFAEIMGASPYFVDPYELDGLIAGSQQLPKLLAVALVNSTTQQPGWHESGKMARKEYARVAELISPLAETKEPGYEAFINRENVLRVLDNLILSLQEIRSDLSADNPTGLKEKVEKAYKGYLDWIKTRKSGDWEKQRKADIPTASESMGRLFGLGRKSKKAD